MKKTVAYRKSDTLCSHRILKCCLCGETDREKLIVEVLGLAAGMSGDDYSFCKKCWFSKNLGQKLLDFLEYPEGMKLIDSAVEYKEVEL